MDAVPTRLTAVSVLFVISPTLPVAVVLVTAVMGKEDSKMSYFPLKIDYEERFYAAGKILGARFTRREGRPSEDAILSGPAGGVVGMVAASARHFGEGAPVRLIMV